jgi:peptidase E
MPDLQLYPRVLSAGLKLDIKISSFEAIKKGKSYFLNFFIEKSRKIQFIPDFSNSFGRQEFIAKIEFC